MQKTDDYTRQTLNIAATRDVARVKPIRARKGGTLRRACLTGLFASSLILTLSGLA
ncbi:hypothetical protein [Candidatus Spongiihabitans sp.]|uniref:hypothetical protein n=1 Tax=Candidatus Spongiihabitans sp. TaxID=3101308 RepID=UPI003C79FA76